MAGYDPLLLDAWLDGFYDDIVMVGMSGELVLDYYRQPIFTDRDRLRGRSSPGLGNPASSWPGRKGNRG